MTDEETILSGEWAICRICEDVFRRKRETLRFCMKCHQGFCEGEHGSFAYGHGTCVICGVKKAYRTRQVPTAVAVQTASAKKSNANV